VYGGRSGHQALRGKSLGRTERRKAAAHQYFGHAALCSSSPLVFLSRQSAVRRLGAHGLSSRAEKNINPLAPAGHVCLARAPSHGPHHPAARAQGLGSIDLFNELESTGIEIYIPRALAYGAAGKMR